MKPVVVIDIIIPCHYQQGADNKGNVMHKPEAENSFPGFYEQGFINNPCPDGEKTGCRYYF